MKTEETIIFNTKKEAHKVSRGLRKFGVLSRLNGREVTVLVTRNGPERDRELALAIHRGEKE